AVAAAHLADDGMPGLERLQSFEHERAEAARALDQALIAIGFDGSDARGAGERMTAVGQSRVQHLLLESLGDFRRQDYRAERQVRARQALRERHEIRPPFLAVALPR